MQPIQNFKRHEIEHKELHLLHLNRFPIMQTKKMERTSNKSVSHLYDVNNENLVCKAVEY